RSLGLGGRCGRGGGGALELVPGAGDLQQLLDGLGGLGTLLEPGDGLVVVDVDHRRLLARLVGADDLDEPAVAGRTGIRGDHPVGGLLLLAHPHEAELDHVDFSSLGWAPGSLTGCAGAVVSAIDGDSVNRGDQPWWAAEGL